MKIIHIPYCFYPDAVGGTEVYVKSLVYYLNLLNIENIIAVPGDKDERYQYEGIQIIRFSISKNLTNLYQLYGNGDLVAVESFSAVLDKEKPDIVHFHAFTSAISCRLMKMTKIRGIKTVFTYHTPTVSCARGTLMKFGQEICNGKLDIFSCSNCNLHSLGLNKQISLFSYFISAMVGKFIKYLDLRGSIWTALQMKYLIAIRHQSFYTAMHTMDRIIALSEWTRNLLHLNNIAKNKISLIHHGLDLNQHQATTLLKKKVELPLRLIFIGRYDPVKGLQFLIDAMQNLKEYPITLDVFGVMQDKSSKYFETLKTKAKNDSRIQFFPSVSNNQIIPLLQNYHLLAVPSQLLETGPLVILEAFAAGTPVIGSNLGGIAELIKEGVNGLLVKHNSIRSWSEALKRCCNNRNLIQQLSAGSMMPTGMDMVANEVYALYKQIL